MAAAIDLEAGNGAENLFSPEDNDNEDMEIIASLNSKV